MESNNHLASTIKPLEIEQHVSFAIPSRTPSLKSVASLRQPRYHTVYQPTKREQLAVQLDNSAIGSIWKLVDAFLNILLCGAYIANTPYFLSSLPAFNVWFEFVMAILLLMEYLPKFYITHFNSWRSLFTHVSPILTFLTVYPVFSVAQDSNFKDTPALVFLYPFRFIRCHLSVHDCFVRSEKSVLRLGQVTSKVLIFIESIIFLILTGSSLLHGVEFVYKGQENLSFLDAVFFTTIMLGTVGYLSDVVPDGAFPRILLLVIFTMGLIFIPYSISELTILLRSKSPYDKAFRRISRQPHVIIITPTIELPSLRHFLKEFYSLAHGPGTINTKVVILNPVDPTERVKTFLSDPMYAHRVQYVRGSSLESRSLKKIRAKDAAAYFILAKKYTQQSESIDAENVLKAMALRKYDEGPKLYIQCILPENKIHFESLHPEQIICIDELKLAILAHSCLTPGFSTLLYGLTTSFTSETAHELRYAKRRRRSLGLDNDSIEDYISGLTQSIYTTTLSDFYSGQAFLLVAENMYVMLGVVLFAIGIPKKRSFSRYSQHWMFDENEEEGQEDLKNYMVLINPGDYIVKGDEIGFIIASDEIIADGLSKVAAAEQSERNFSGAHMIHGDSLTERQPLLSPDSLKSSGSGYFDLKKKYSSIPPITPRTPEYPHKPDSIPSIRRQRALSTPLAFGAEHPHPHPHPHPHQELLHSHTIDPVATSSTVPLPVLHEIEGKGLLIDNIDGHILLCDYSTTTFPRNLDCFVSPLRKSHLGKLIPIVILSPARPSQSQWRILSQFDQVYFQQGNPMTREGLESGRVTHAKQVVILTDATRILRNGEKTEDASAMLVFLNIKAMCQQNVEIFVEFVHMDNMKFMSEDTAAIDKEMQAHHSPAFMAGTCFSLSMLDSIICQSFYQPHLVAIIQQMLFGAPPLHLPSGATCPAPAHSHVFQIPMPQLYIGAHYEDLFVYMVSEKKSVPLGLYRTRTVQTPSGDLKELNYVYTCPKSQVILRSDDRLFLLSRKAPSVILTLTSDAEEIFFKKGLHCFCKITSTRAISSFAGTELSEGVKKSSVNNPNKAYSDTLLLPKTDFPLRADPIKREKLFRERCTTELYQWQLENNPQDTFILHDGPPYANGELHIGHALNKILKDIINRYQILQGYKVNYIPGWDCHGLPIELKALSELKATNRSALSPIEIRKIARATALNAIETQKSDFISWGIIGDWEHAYRTLDNDYEIRQLKVFNKMAQKAESELDYHDHKSKSVYVKLLVEKLPLSLQGILPADNLKLSALIWTTTPWSLPANQAIAVNPLISYSIISANPIDGSSPEYYIVATNRFFILQQLVGLETTLTQIAEFSGSQIVGISYLHPITNIYHHVISASYVTDDSGTGLVHIAPGHGLEDYEICKNLNIPAFCPVDDLGNFTSDVGVLSLEGKFVLDNGTTAVIEYLKAKNLLLREEIISHKYPYDWRTKKPIILRATSQWFANLEDIKKKAFASLAGVKMIPENSRNRLEGFIQSRSEWCISRQRAWGVPIPVLYDTETDEPLLTDSSVKYILEIIRKLGSDGWWTTDERELLAPEYRDNGRVYRKGYDTMDVWFDSGVSWSLIDEKFHQRQKQSSLVDVYLEGNDQHRGWFQSSLLTSIAVNEKPPYSTLITHGFVVDEQGRKMSKSLGNIVQPKTIIQGGKNIQKDPPYGVDVLRLWVASAECAKDVTIGPAVMSQVAESLRKYRNNSRFMLSNLNDFTHDQQVSFDRLRPIDQYMLHELYQFGQKVQESYQDFSFQRVVQTLNNFSNVGLSAFYFEIIKDCLYADHSDSLSRRAAQTVLYHILNVYTLSIAPIAPHLAEEIYDNFKPSGPVAHSSVFKLGWYHLEDHWNNPIIAKEWEIIKNVRGEINQLLATARKNKSIKSSLEAKVYLLNMDEKTIIYEVLKKHELGLKGIFITSDAKIYSETTDMPLQSLTENVSFINGKINEIPIYEKWFSFSDGGKCRIIVKNATAKKCPRCWNYTVTKENDICDRCEKVVKKNRNLS
ncbi:hypothetical protein G9A89_002831 [Geosiphon pyriformis]|nr:hypothetical protein G9A89_002831 [Geosiphon pyriformis]